MNKNINMPFALDYEEAILGALLLETKAMPIASQYLRPEMFYDDKHQQIYSAIEGMFNEGRSIDIITVTEELKRRGKLEDDVLAWYRPGWDWRRDPFRMRLPVEPLFNRPFLPAAEAIGTGPRRHLSEHGRREVVLAGLAREAANRPGPAVDGDLGLRLYRPQDRLAGHRTVIQ